MPRGGRKHLWSAAATRYAKYRAGGFQRIPGGYPPVRTLVDMSEEEIQDIERRYNMPVIRPRRVAL